MECPICMDDIQVTVNCVTTECGHCFHASCLMRSVAHNGFGCPYCRTAMAEQPAEEEEEDEYDEEEEEEDDEFALRGFRFFFNNLAGEEHNPEDVEEDQVEEPSEEPIVKPTAAFITQKLVDQGITMEHLVKALLKDHEEYDAEEEEFLRMDDELFGKFRIIISNFEEPAPAPVPESQPAVQQDPLPLNVTFRRIGLHM